MIEKIKKNLEEAKDLKYQKFSSSLLPNVKNVLGVRIPVLRKIANEIYKEDYEKFFKENDDEFFELTMIEAMILGKIDFDFKKIEKFVDKISNWSVCDCFCSGLKKTLVHKKETKLFLEKYFKSDKEYENRFAYVMLLNYFVKDDIDYVLQKILEFKNEKYYAMMAVAWCLSYCFIFHFDLTFEFIKKNLNSFDKVALKKGIQKAFESFRVDKKDKEKLRQFKSYCGL